MNSPILHSPLFIALLVFEILFIIAFAIFFIFFFIKRKTINNEYSIKDTYNDIHHVSSINNFSYLTVLSKNNPILKDLMIDVNQSKDFFEQQLNIVKDKIITLTDMNEEFSFLSANMLKAEINQDLNFCLIMSEKLKKTISNTTIYSKNVANLLTSYRLITDELFDFYEHNLSVTYKHEIFKNFRESIETSLANVSEYVLKINNDKLMKSLTSLNRYITIFYKTVKHLYIFDKVDSYLTSYIAKIKKQLSEKSALLSNDDTILINKRIANANVNLGDLKAQLKNININEANNYAIVAIKHIEFASKIISQTDRLNILVQKNIKFLNEQIQDISKKTKIIQNAFSVLVDRFNESDQSVISKVNDLSFQLKAIAISYERITKQYNSSYNSIQKDKFIISIKEALDQIRNFKSELETLSNEIYKKYRSSISLLDEIATVKLILVQLLGTKIKLNSNDTETIKAIRISINKIDDLEKLINDNYFINYTKVFSEIQEIKKHVIDIIKTCTFDNELKLYSQRLFIFLNKYRNENEDINNALNVAEKYYFNNRFEETINILIESLDIIKKASEINRIAFD